MLSLAEIYQLLQRNEHAAALAELNAIVVGSPADQARVHAWKGQALRSLGRPAEGLFELIQAIRITKQAGDSDALPGLREIHADIARSMASLQLAQAAKQQDADILAKANDNLDADGLIRKAQAAIEQDMKHDAIHLSHLALTRTQEPRHQVLALLVLSRCDSVDHLHEAHRIADDANDENLVAAVAQTAKLLGVRLRRPSFG